MSSLYIVLVKSQDSVILCSAVSLVLLSIIPLPLQRYALFVAAILLADGSLVSFFPPPPSLSIFLSISISPSIYFPSLISSLPLSLPQYFSLFLILSISSNLSIPSDCLHGDLALPEYMHKPAYFHTKSCTPKLCLDLIPYPVQYCKKSSVKDLLAQSDL